MGGLGFDFFIPCGGPIWAMNTPNKKKEKWLGFY